jgi:hypothetical protein
LTPEGPAAQEPNGVFRVSFGPFHARFLAHTTSMNRRIGRKTASNDPSKSTIRSYATGPSGVVAQRRLLSKVPAEGAASKDPHRLERSRGFAHHAARASGGLRAGFSPAFGGWARRLPPLALFATTSTPGGTGGNNAEDGTSVSAGWGARAGEALDAGASGLRCGAGRRSGGPWPTEGASGRCRCSIEDGRGARSVEARCSAPATADGGRDARRHNHRRSSATGSRSG